MRKSLLSALAVGLCLSANVMAQVPSYVPTNGLVGYWPFNGNANDESGNGNNGTVNGATLTNDRNGVANKAYSFDGVDDFITISNSVTANIIGSYSVNFWMLSSNLTLQIGGQEVIADRDQTTYDFKFRLIYGIQQTPFTQDTYIQTCSNGNNNCFAVNTLLPSSSIWENYSIVYNANNQLFSAYKNSVLIGSVQNTIFSTGNRQINLGRSVNPDHPDGTSYFNGNIDDIGIWNRALTAQEITALYNSCQGTTITSQPSNSSVNIGSSAQFSVGSTIGGSYQWQSNPLNTGWLNLTNNSTYSGVASNTLTISNTTVSNHNQPFRAIVNASGCLDTSDVAQIFIGDTCLTTVTDTLIINTTLGLPAPNNENTILIYPNPASDHITIDNGNYTAMAGYTIKIENNAGQQVFQSLINQAQFYVDLSTWSGNGLYFVHLIDAQGNTVTVRKIVLQ